MSKPLTWRRPTGEWGIEGVDLAKLPPQVYGALCKLKDMEHPEFLALSNSAALRAMNDKELAEILAYICKNWEYCICPHLEICDENRDSGKPIPFERCWNCMLRWLQDPWEGKL